MAHLKEMAYVQKSSMYIQSIYYVQKCHFVLLTFYSVTLYGLYCKLKVKDITKRTGGIDEMAQLKEMAYAQKSRMVLLIIFALISGVSIIGQAYFFVTIVDRIFLQKQSFQEIVPFMFGLLAEIGRASCRESIEQ